MTVPILQRRSSAAVLGGLGFLLIGWTGLLVPSLIRSVEGGFGQTDAGIGLFYFVDAVAYVSGSLVGGFLTERLGRRAVLSSAAALVGVGLVAMGSVPSWTLFLLAALPLGLGSGAIDGGVNGLYLDLYPTSRGQALNRVHLFFSLGALTSPLIVGRLVDAGVAWQAVILGTTVVAFPLAVLLAVTGLPSGRHHRPGDGSSASIGYALPLILLAVAIGCYVASEIGVSSWLVRYLSAAPLSTATAALSLFWAGNLLGRLVSARFADRFDHLRLAIASSLVAASTIIVALVAPSLELSIALVRAGRLRIRADLPVDHGHRRRPVPRPVRGRQRVPGRDRRHRLDRLSAGHGLHVGDRRADDCDARLGAARVRQRGCARPERSDGGGSNAARLGQCPTSPPVAVARARRRPGRGVS